MGWVPKSFCVLSSKWGRKARRPEGGPPRTSWPPQNYFTKGLHEPGMGLFGFGRKKLTKKQRAQRKYAASVKALRTRASRRRGGKGPVAKRSSAAKLRRKLGLKKRR